MKKLEFLVEQAESGERIDVKASQAAGLSRARVQQLIDAGMLTVNNKKVKHNYRIKAGEVISIELNETQENETLLSEDLPLRVVHIDDDVAVVDKPAGMVVYPAAGHPRGTLMNAVAFHSAKLASVGGPLRPGVVHRLDKDTSGVMVVALNDRSYYDLVEQFRERSIQRKYKALVFGHLKEDKGEIFLKIARSESERKKMTTRSGRGKDAVTNWVVRERFPVATLVEAKLGTGRTHQIRVHFAAIGHPVLGDNTYGHKMSIEYRKKKITFQRQMLHAELLGFVHPGTGEYVEFSSPLPDDMAEIIVTLRSL